MSSADNTIETADGNSTVDQSLPSTTSVLDRSRSLFGNSSAVLSTPDRQSTPDEPVGETSEENYAIEEVTETLVETPVDQEDESLKPADEEPMDTAESETTPEPEKEAEEATEDKEQNGEADEQDVEESFEKKTISMDTGGDEDEPVEEPMDSEDNDEQEKETEEKEEEHEEVEDEEEETPKRKAKRAAPTSEDEDVEEQTEKSEDKEEKVEEEEEKEEQEEKEETPEEETPKRNTRGRRSTASTSSAKRGKGRASEVKKDDEEATEEVEEQTPKRGGRARRSTVQETPEVEESSSRPRRSVRGRKSNVEPEPEPEPEEEKEEEVEEKEEEVGEEKKPKKGRKSKAQEVEAVEEEEEAVADEEPEVPTSSRRSARSKPPPKSAPVTPATKRTPARGRKKQTSLTEEPIEEEEPETPKRGRAAAKNTPASSKKKNESSFDPYDLDTEMEHHPEPLKNIHMEVQNFGAVKYAKVGSSESKYAMTEKAAESRISNLPATPSNKNRRSLADMTPGKEKVKHKTPVVSVGRKPRAKKGGEPEEEDVEMEATPERASSSATSSTSNRGRKRKSEAVESAPSSAKKQPTLLRTLSEEEQLQVDHPSNENEPHAPGARVYALFQKTFYPAIIMAERDGMGRYKLQFTADKVIKDVPNAGIIPLRAVSAGKTAIFEEEEVHIRAGTNDISSSEWAKGQVLIVILDEDGEPTDEEKTISWQDISFDQTEWRDYIKDKEQNATAVVSSNITTPLEATRARKPRSIVQSKPPTKPKSHPKITGDLAPSRGASTPRNFDDEDDDKLLPMNEEGVGKNIFAGKVFMLTSANRTTDRYVPSVFKKKNMMEFITQNGGVVTELLDEFQERYSTSDSILISDTYYRTHKYLAALARGVPCVSNLWLQACGEQGEMVDFAPFILPAGASIFDDEDKPAPRDPSKLLEGKTMYVHSVHTTREITQNGPGGTFIEIWNPILELLGAKTVYGDWKDLPQSQLKFDIVLVDGTFQREVMDYAESIGAATVTSEWVIQSIILNGPPDPKSHPKFDPHRLNQRSPV